MAQKTWKDLADLVGMIAIIAGLLLVAYELRQNSQLMRAQISMDRASMAVESWTAVANGGEIARIQAKLKQEVDGYPFEVGMSDVLTPEEYERYRMWAIVRSNEIMNDWFQCSEGYVDEESCQRHVMTRMHLNMVRAYEFGIDYSRWPVDAVRELQPYTEEYGLPDLNDDGTWKQ